MELTLARYYQFKIRPYLSFGKMLSLIKKFMNNDTDKIITQYKHLIELSPEPIVVLEEDKIIFANQPASNLLGAESSNRLLNCSMIDFVDESYKEKAHESLSKFSKSGEDSIIADVKIRNMKNDVRYIQGIATEIIYENKKAILVMLRDISQLKEREEVFKRIAEETKKVEQMKSHFLNQMSHEIRSPLHAMMLAINLLEEDLNLDTEFPYPNYFSVIKSSSRRITKTVDLILNSAELASNLYSPLFEEVDVNVLLAQVVAEYRDNAAIKGLKLKLNSSTEHTKTIGDEYSLMQVFSNLVDNAIKFTNKGEVNINLKRDNAFRLSVEIIDTGIGVSKDYLPNIFEDFTQESDGYCRKFEGAGLGMAVVKKFCDLNEIKIKIVSEIGIGTKITLLFLINGNKNENH